MLAAGGALAADYRTTADAPTVLYDAPSAKARPLFVYGRDVPLEVLVVVEGWTKIRDTAGAFGWIANKSLSDKRMLLVRVPVAEVRANPDEAAPRRVPRRAERPARLGRKRRVAGDHGHARLGESPPSRRADRLCPREPGLRPLIQRVRHDHRRDPRRGCLGHRPRHSFRRTRGRETRRYAVDA